MRKIPAFASLLVAVVLASVVAGARGTEMAPTEMAPSPAAGFTPYSCKDLPVSGAVIASAPEVVEIRALADRAAPPTVREALAIASRLRAWAGTPRGVKERVVAQNAAFALARKTTSVFGKAVLTELVRALAPSSTELEALGQEPEEGADAFVGPREAWVTRKTPSCGDGPLAHDHAFGGELSFRVVRSGSQRALVAQLVAIDDAGRTHVTPIVGLVEMRRGLGHDAPACVIELEARAGRVGLATQDQHELHRTAFVTPVEGGVTCERCHRNMPARDLSPEESAALLGTRRAAFATWADASWRGVLGDR